MTESRVGSMRDPRGLAEFLFDRVDARLRDMGLDAEDARETGNIDQERHL
jgi:hypothetical protein